MPHRSPPLFFFPARSLARLIGAALLLGLAATPAGASADSGIAERIVAVVGDQPLLLSELRERARPFLARIKASVPSGPQQVAAMTQMYQDLLRKMIDDLLVATAARRVGLVVAPAEVDMTLRQIAAQAGVGIPQLLAVAAEQGLSEEAYREEIERQLIEGKMVNLRMHARNAAGGQSAEQVRVAMLKELRAAQYIDVRL